MKHTPDDPARCPTCGGAMVRVFSSMMMVCENSIRRTRCVQCEHYVALNEEACWWCRTPVDPPTCQQEPMYLVPADA